MSRPVETADRKEAKAPLEDLAQPISSRAAIASTPTPTPAPRWGHAPSGSTRAFVLPLRVINSHPALEQIVALGALVRDRGQILGQ
jgi:hypothetical protein